MDKEERQTAEVYEDFRLRDPLSAVTRKERLYLLAVSSVNITIVFTGLVPSQIAALGITFAQADRQSLLFILALVNAYFLSAFILYAWSDYLAWRRLFNLERLRRFRKRLEPRDDIEPPTPYKRRRNVS
jgi:hypothetical protein